MDNNCAWQAAHTVSVAGRVRQAAWAALRLATRCKLRVLIMLMLLLMYVRLIEGQCR